MNELIIALINDKAKPPHRQDDSIGYDVFAFSDHTLSPGETKIIPVGFHAALPIDHGAFVWDRSSFGAKGIHIFHQMVTSITDLASLMPFGGVIDWSYRGQWG